MSGASQNILVLHAGQEPVDQNRAQLLVRLIATIADTLANNGHVQLLLHEQLLL